MDATTASRVRFSIHAITRYADAIAGAIDAAMVAVPEEAHATRKAADPRPWLTDAAALHRGPTAPLAKDALARAAEFLAAAREAENMLREAWAGHDTEARGQIRDDLCESARDLCQALARLEPPPCEPKPLPSARGALDPLYVPHPVPPAHRE